jgi:NAD(P)-dependent dehydrogenase (short-subunit alcohol dehydrogenase family)
VSEALRGRRVALTGGSRGIGFAIARRLLNDGASVVFCARDAASVEAATSTLRASVPGGVVQGLVADVSDTAAVEEFAHEAIAELGGIDSLVCNSGIWGPKGAVDRFDFDEWLRAFDVNVHGVVRTVRAFLPALRESGGGRIVIMSGGGAYQPYPYLSAYGATKSAVTRFGESIAEELLADNILVNMMLPGPVNTSMVDELIAAGPEVLGEKRYAKVMQQKEGGGTSPERGAALCSFLLSDRIAGITGKLISVADDHDAIANNRDAVMKSDLFTLRRITPAARAEQ